MSSPFHISALDRLTGLADMQVLYANHSCHRISDVKIACWVRRNIVELCERTGKTLLVNHLLRVASGDH